MSDNSKIPGKEPSAGTAAFERANDLINSERLAEILDGRAWPTPEEQEAILNDPDTRFVATETLAFLDTAKKDLN